MTPKTTTIPLPESPLYMLHPNENYNKKKHIEFVTPKTTTTPPPESPLYMLHTCENYKSKNKHIEFEPENKPQLHRLNHPYTCYTHMTITKQTENTTNSKRKSLTFVYQFSLENKEQTKKSFEKKKWWKKKREKIEKWGYPPLSTRMRVESKSQFNCTPISNRNLKTTSGLREEAARGCRPLALPCIKNE